MVCSRRYYNALQEITRTSAQNISTSHLAPPAHSYAKHRSWIWFREAHFTMHDHKSWKIRPLVGRDIQDRAWVPLSDTQEECLTHNLYSSLPGVRKEIAVAGQ